MVLFINLPYNVGTQIAQNLLRQRHLFPPLHLSTKGSRAVDVAEPSDKKEAPYRALYSPIKRQERFLVPPGKKAPQRLIQSLFTYLKETPVIFQHHMTSFKSK